jgi:acylphosphatase
MIRRRVLVRGRVQGVWFRDSCRAAAQGAGVGGWVRNLHDGRVEAAFEGDPDAVDEMVEWCRQGPPSAVVVDIDVIDESPEGDTTFRIK